METKKEIIKEIEKSLQDAMETLWKVERKYGDIHHVMNTLRDGNIISNNMQGALLKLTIERYFERHEGETEFNDVKKAIHDISDAKLKMIELQAKTMIENELQLRKISEMERQQKEMKEVVEESKAPSIEKIIDIEMPVDQEMDITLRPTPVREDLLKPKLEKCKNWTVEQWNAFRGEKIKLIDAIYIRKNVAKEVGENLDKGTRYILENVISKYYPFASRKTQGGYTRTYFKYFNKSVKISTNMVRGISCDEEIPLGKYEQSDFMNDIDLVEYKDKVAVNVHRKYDCQPNSKNLAIVLDVLLTNGKKTLEEISEISGVNVNRTYTHLRYACEMGFARLKMGNYRITKYGRELFPQLALYKALEIDEMPKKEKAQEEDMRKKFEGTTPSKITRRAKGKKITDKIAKRINKTYSTKLTVNRYEAILRAVYLKPGGTKAEYKKMTDFSMSPVYAHLRYGVETGDIKSENKRYTLRANGIKKAEKLFEETKVNESKTVEKEKKRDATIGKNQRYESLSMLFDEKYGKKITDDIAKKMEKKYHYSVRAPTLNIILDDIKKNPGTSMKEVRDRTGFSAVKTNVHMQYGLETERLLMKDYQYYVVEGVKPAKEEMPQDLKEEAEEKIVTPKVQLEGTPITDIIAQNVHIKYGSPVMKERYEKIKNILEGALLYKRTVSQLSEQTGWSKHNIYIHILYGSNKKIGEIISCGENQTGAKEYCLTKNKNKVIKPKDVKVKSKSWLKW